ncbi:hypothetical protein [Virgibacillus oceani]|uniref:Uncharacterized protein n=1 Tax=Virgibacillus oceani TaxID=1479511 RepID=A0A917HKA7_9BACI|nr:hypothetical protein [Virgibacillus oceani]GGG82426.1 hypothetical protein GCM10011398_29910 [Virgibacillus oceani]
MELKQREYFDDFLTESFSDDIHHRELRLSSNEMESIKKKYPKATIKACTSNQSTDGKMWFEVTIHPV